MSKQNLVVANKKGGFATKGTVTIKDEHSINCYFKDINNYPILNKEDERKLLERFLIDGDEVAKEKVLKANLKFVISIAKMYLGKGLPFEDLINEGNIGLIKAIEKYDLRRDIKFISYAVWWIRQSINQALVEKGSGIKLPVNKRDSINRINRIEKELEVKLNRKPTVNEIIDHNDSINVKSTKLPLDEMDVKKIQDCRLTEMSFDTTVSGDNDEFTLLDTLPADPIELKTNEQKFEMELNDILKCLTKKEKNIIKMSFGLMEVKEVVNLDEIANIYGLSKERIRQIRETAIRKLRNNPKVSILFDFMHNM